MTEHNHAYGEQVAEFSEKQAELAQEWLRLNHIAVEWKQEEARASQKAAEARRMADKAYAALHDHVFGLWNG